MTNTALDKLMKVEYQAWPVAVACILDDELIHVYESATQRLLVEVRGGKIVIYSHTESRTA